MPFESSRDYFGHIGYPFNQYEYQGYGFPETRSTSQVYVKKGNQTWGTPYTFTVGLNENSTLANKVTLYPNPARSFVQLQTDLNVIEVKLFSANGQTLSETANKKQINVEGLNSGLYILRIITNEGAVNKQLVIE